ncbi:MAG: tyrosine-type recombinase/integrase [Bacilli bacterium]
MPIYKSSTGWMYKCCINSHQYCKRGFKTKKEAELAEAAFKLNFKEIKSLSNIKLSVSIKNYLSSLQDHTSKGNLYTLKLRLNKYVLNYFNDINLNQLTSSKIVNWYYYLKDIDLTLHYKNNVLKLVRQFFKYLNLYYNFDNSIFDKLHLFKDYSIKPIIIDEVDNYITINEFKNLYNSINDSYWKLYISLSFFLGLRLGELKALTNDENSINHKYKALLIYKQLVYAGVGKPVLSCPKSKASDRVYYLPDFLYNMLIDHISKFKLKTGDYIFFSKANKKKAISSTTIRRKLDSYSVGLSIKLYPHKFRHSAATNLFENGALKEDIKNFLGHETSEVTMNVYVHKTKEEVDRVNNVLEDIFNKIKE